MLNITGCGPYKKQQRSVSLSRQRYMQNKEKKSYNPWYGIPLSDYENHMSHPLVGQAILLNTLTKKYLRGIKPQTAIFLGVAGGNGLEHVDPDSTAQVIGIDINQEYLDMAWSRYKDKINGLKLLNLDLRTKTGTIARAGLIWAALVLEYTGIDKSLEFAVNNLLPGGRLVITIQSNNLNQAVSQTGIESVKKAGSIFSVVDPETLAAKAAEMGFIISEREENSLPNGKSLITFCFIL
jgi:hypothetical protein